MPLLRYLSWGGWRECSASGVKGSCSAPATAAGSPVLSCWLSADPAALVITPALFSAGCRLSPRCLSMGAIGSVMDGSREMCRKDLGYSDPLQEEISYPCSTYSLHSCLRCLT